MLSPTATNTEESQLSSTPIPNGTPDVPLRKAFGAGYTVFAYAQMDISPSSKFDFTQLKQDPQSLDQKRPYFIWIITPEETTQVDMNVSVIGQWKPVGAGDEIDIPLWIYSQSYNVASVKAKRTISTTPSFFQTLTSLGSALFAILPVLGGLGLTIPWILDQFKKMRNQSKQIKRKNPRRRKQ